MFVAEGVQPFTRPSAQRTAFRESRRSALSRVSAVHTLAETVQEWTKDWVAQGRKEGRAQERRQLCRQAARKFDVGAAARLGTALSDATDPERLAQVGEWIIECETAADLMAPVLDKTSAGD